MAQLGNLPWLACTIKLARKTAEEQYPKWVPEGCTEAEVAIPGHFMGFTQYGDEDGHNTCAAVCMPDGRIVERDPLKVQITEPMCIFRGGPNNDKL